MNAFDGPTRRSNPISTIKLKMTRDVASSALPKHTLFGSQVAEQQFVTNGALLAVADRLARNNCPVGVGRW